jgi:hypothetical protein
MAQLTVQSIVGTGLAPSFAAAAAGGDSFLNDGKTFLEVKNASGSSITVTITAQNPCNQGQLHNLAVSVPATTGDRMIGLLLPSIFNDANGLVQVTYSAVTSLTVAAFKAA